eukprot:265432_1
MVHAQEVPVQALQPTFRAPTNAEFTHANPHVHKATQVSGLWPTIYAEIPPGQTRTDAYRCQAVSLPLLREVFQRQAQSGMPRQKEPPRKVGRTSGDGEHAEREHAEIPENEKAS